MFNALIDQRNQYQKTVSEMEKYYKQFGIESLANLFNQVAKRDPEVWRAEKVITNEDLKVYSDKDMGEMWGVNMPESQE
jgi:hypothetical protein